MPSPQLARLLACAFALAAVPSCGGDASEPADDPFAAEAAALTAAGPTTRLIVSFSADATQRDRAVLHEVLGATFIRRLRSGHDLVSVPTERASKVLAAYRTSAAVVRVDLDVLLAPSHATRRVPNDPDYGRQWHAAEIGLPEAWSMTTGRPEVLVAVCDSGISPTHPDLAPRLRMDLCFNTASDTPGDCGPNNTHGTLVAGALAAIGNNGRFGAGVAWDVSIIPVRITNLLNAHAYSADIGDCIRYGADHGASVVNVSYGSQWNNAVIPEIQDGANYAESRGVLTVISAGNEATNPTGSEDPDAIFFVSASGQGGSFTSFSNFGPFIDIAAPGDNIYAAAVAVTCADANGDELVDPGSCQFGGDGYSISGGTSIAAPLVSGAAALMKALRPSASPAEIRAALRATASDKGAPGEDDQFGAGVMNVHAALHAIDPLFVPNEPPAITLTTPSSGSIIVVAGTSVTLSAGASDREDGDRTASLVWTRWDNRSYTGGTVSFNVGTTVATRAVTLAVADSRGLVTTKRMTVKVIARPAMAAPVNLKATLDAGRKVKLVWEDASSAERGFSVQRAKVTNGTVGAWSTRATLRPNVETFTDQAVAGTFSYRIRAFDSSRNLYSRAVRITVP